MKLCLFSQRVLKESIKIESDLIVTDIIQFNSMVRRAYALTVLERDKGIKPNKSIHLIIKEEFKVNDYYANSAVQEAKAKYNNVVENHKLHISATESKVDRISKKIKDTEKAIVNKEKVLNSIIAMTKVITYNKTAKKPKKLPKFKTYKGAVEYLADEESLTFAVRKKVGKDVEYNMYTFEVCYLKPTIKRLKNRVKMLKYRLNRESEKVARLKSSKPTACFGSKALFKKQNTSYRLNHELWRKQWFKSRNRKMIISGRKDSANGNFVFRYDVSNNSLHFTTMSGESISLDNIVFPYGQQYVNQAVTAKKEDRRSIAWSIEDMGEYFIIKAIVDIPKSRYINYSKDDGIVGVDINEDHLAWADVDRYGNLIDFGTINFNLKGLSTGQARIVIELAVCELIAICVRKRKPLGMEDLDLKKSSKELLYNSKKLNAKLSAFAYAKFTSAIESRACKQNIGVFKRNPAFTSQIGKIKYMKQKGLSIHIAAAYVIGRRAMGLRELVPHELKKFIPKEKLHNHHWSHWRQLSTKLKSVHPNKFYKNLNLDECQSIKEYAELLG